MERFKETCLNLYEKNLSQNDKIKNKYYHEEINRLNQEIKFLKSEIISLNIENSKLKNKNIIKF